MRKLALSAIVLTLIFSGTAVAEMSQHSVMVGGSAMMPNKNIVQNALNSKDHTTLVAALKEAGLVDTLEGEGPFTVFAPTNEAFSKLPSGTVENLLKPENKKQLTDVLTYHVVPGKYDMKKMAKMLKDGDGKAELKTANGEALWIMSNGPHNIQIKDAKGNIANISTYDVMQKNGVIDVIDTVLMPQSDTLSCDLF